ncbi:MAG: ABC transporter permease [Treponema sp.]|jgi:peptide/nickel transport system permease protein|nr:ABC transporter permease [Treponema sp.]
MYTEEKVNGEELALDDERRVKVLSPSALMAKRFFANRLALIGMVILIAMFLFSFIGGLLMPYREDQLFLTYEEVVRDFVSAAYSNTVQTTSIEGFDLSVMSRGSLVSAIQNGQSGFSADGVEYAIAPLGAESWLITARMPVATITSGGVRYTFMPQGGASVSDSLQASAIQAIEGNNAAFEHEGLLYSVSQTGRRYTLAVSREAVLASRLTVSPLVSGFQAEFRLLRDFEQALAAGSASFAGAYAIRRVGESYYISLNGVDQFVASHYSIQPTVTNTIVSAEMRTMIENAIAGNETEFTFDGVSYQVSGVDGQYSIKTAQSTQLVSMLERPSLRHWLGTDKNGMDVVVRLMYGGRVSLLIGFVVVVIEILIGVVMGGLAGYFGKVVDMVIMRIVDTIICIPSLPLYLIVGAFMDGNKVDPNIRIYVLMLIMGFMSWPGVARVVRGQILSLREREFMVAAEALGLRVSRRIFRHLIPNVIPQLIVVATMDLGSVILSESTLSFLGLGVKFPLASWGNILNAVNDVHVMTNYLYVWIPAGFCILVTVLGFNFVGDGLRDAFDPKMKR